MVDVAQDKEVRHTRKYTSAMADRACVDNERDAAVDDV